MRLKDDLAKFRQVRLNFVLRNFLVFTLLFTFFTLAVWYGFTQLTKHNHIRFEEARYRNMLERTVSQLEQQFELMERLGIYVATLPKLQHLDQGNKELSSVVNEVYATLIPFGVPSSNREQRLTLLSEQGDFHSIGYPTQTTVVQQRLNSPWFQTWYAKASSEEQQLEPPHLDYWNSSTYYPFTYTRVLRDVYSLKQVGLVSIELPATTLQKILSSSGSETLSLIDDQGQSLSLDPMESRTDWSELDEVLLNPARSQVSQFHGKLSSHAPALYLAAPLKHSRWRLLLTIDDQQLFASVIGESQHLMLGFALIYCLTLGLGYSWFKRTAKPLIQLREQFDRVTQDHLVIQLDSPLRGNDLDRLNRSLSLMVKRLQEAADENSRLHTRELHASFLALQAQINPHFLFNTLGVLALQAEEDGKTALSSSIQRLSKLLRYVTTSTPTVVTLGEELAQLEDYLSLLKLRFEDQFHYKIHLSDPSLNTKIQLPRTSLQPLLENAFTHGFSKILPPWSLELKIESAQETWRMSFLNNGPGLSEEARLQLENRIQNFLTDPTQALSSLRIGGMGLVSSLARFHHLYAPHFQYYFPPRDQGFELVLEGSFHVETLDC